MSFGSTLSGLFSAATSAVNAGNITAAASSLTALQGALGTSQTTITKATQFINNFNLAQAENNPAGMQNALNGLNQMSDQLPSAAAPYLAELNNPAIMTNPAASAAAITQISVALAHSTFL